MIKEIDGEPITAKNVARFINEGKISNLTQIMWVDLIKYMSVISYSYSSDCSIFQQIIDEITDNKVKVRAIEVMELNCRMYGKHLFKYKNQMENIMSFLDELKRYVDDYDLYNIDAVKRLEMPQSTAKATDKQSLPLPKELNNPTFEVILKKAIKAGFVKETAEGYKWNGNNNELAYFAQKVSDLLGLSNKENDAKKFVNWQPFVKLFGIDKKTKQKLYGALSEVTHDKYPQKKKEIDSLFD